MSDALSIDDKVEIDEIILEIEGEIEEQDGRIKIHRKNLIRILDFSWRFTFEAKIIF